MAEKIVQVDGGVDGEVDGGEDGEVHKTQTQ